MIDGGHHLIPLIFVRTFDDHFGHHRAEDMWELLFADGLAILAESEDQLQEGMLIWQKDLERFGLKMNAIKTETLLCSRVGGQSTVSRGRRGDELKKVESFQYMGSTLCQIGWNDVQERLNAIWMKWMELSGVLHDSRMPIKLKV